FISQAVLTGEALPVEKYDTLGDVTQKSATLSAADQSNLLDLPNICFMGTNVVSGTATAVVVATGAETYFGSLARNVVSHKRIETSLMVPIVFFLNGFSKGDWGDAFLFALAVAVGLTPEMLPMIVTSTLAKGAVFLSRKKVIVKRLDAIQNFGAMDVLCTDKTGTLTQDRIFLARHVDVWGAESDDVLEMA
ncbi:MAG: HAD-IC family P-type ATPase, partial [Comamonas sp.]